MSLVAFEKGRCPSCDATTSKRVATMPALFCTGGYGAARRTVERFCICGWHLVAAVDEVNPKDHR